MIGRSLLKGVRAVAFALGGCSGDDRPETEVPAAISDMMAADFPADGQIHVRSFGKFEITPETKVCRARRDVVSNLKDVAPSLLGPGLGEAGSAASSGLSGRLGEDMGDGTVCTPDRINVINTWALSLNRDDAPYRLVVAMWQGDPANGGAAWIGGLEWPFGSRPNIPVMSPFDIPREEPLAAEDRERLSRLALRTHITADVNRLSAAGTNFLSGEQ